jgi:hypothetical protein
LPVRIRSSRIWIILILTIVLGQSVACFSRRSAIRFAPDGGLFVVVQSRVRASEPMASGGTGIREVHCYPQKEHCRDIAASPDCSVIAGLTADRYTSFFDRASGGLLRTADFAVGDLKCLTFTPGCRRVAGRSRGQVLLFGAE